MSICRQLVARGLLLTLLGVAGWARAETLVIAGDIWCPVNCQPGTERPGIFVELAREIFAESGIEVQYQALNWARTLQQVRRGQLNAAIGAGVEDAPDFLFGSTPWRRRVAVFLPCRIPPGTLAVLNHSPSNAWGSSMTTAMAMN